LSLSPPSIILNSRQGLHQSGAARAGRVGRRQRHRRGEQIRQRGHRQARLRHRDSGREKPAFAGEENAATHHRQPAARAAYARANRRPGPEALAARRGNSRHRAVGGMPAVDLQLYADRGGEAVGGVYERLKRSVARWSARRCCGKVLSVNPQVPRVRALVGTPRLRLAWTLTGHLLALEWNGRLNTQICDSQESRLLTR